MPLKLTALDRVPPHLPLRDQLANVIRRAIAEGELQPGEALDSEQQIADAVGVDKATVRRAVDRVAAEGLLIKANGKRTIVAPSPPVRHIDTTRYRALLASLRAGQPAETAFVTDHAAAWEDYTMDPIAYTEELATEFHARHLQVPVGTLLIKRYSVKNIGGEPVQIQISFIPYENAFGTILADPSVQPYRGGTLAELYDVGLLEGKRVAVAEEVGYIPASDEIRRALNIKFLATPMACFHIVRTITTDGVPIEMSQVIAPAVMNVLRYETDLS